MTITHLAAASEKSIPSLALLRNTPNITTPLQSTLDFEEVLAGGFISNEVMID